MPPGGGGDLDSSEHARNLIDSGGVAQNPDLALHGAVFERLLDRPLRVRLGGYLGQVRHAKNLPALPQCLQVAPDHFCHRPADSCVDLIEYKRRDRSLPAGDDLDGEAYPGQLPARDHLRERSPFRARIGGPQKLDVLVTGRTSLG